LCHISHAVNQAGDTGGASREAETQQAILDAAIECFTHYGNEKTSIADVARVAAVSRQTIYRYFPDRAALLEAVDALESERLRRDVERIGSESASFEEFLAGVIESRAATVKRYRTRQHLIDRDRGLFHSLFVSQSRRIDQLRLLVAPHLRSARQRGELRPDVDDDAAAEWIAITLASLTTITQAHSFDLDDPSAVGAFYARHICRGLVGPPPAGGGRGRPSPSRSSTTISSSNRR
jgi:AcrR family transcriptional regulator